MRRRTGQSGYILVKNKAWYGRYYEDQADGFTRKRKSIRLGSVREMTKSQARLKLKAYLEELRVNDIAVSTAKITKFESYFQWWEQNVLALHKQGYQEKVAAVVNTHILPYFGDTPLDSIGQEKVQEFIAHLTKSDLSAVYIRDMVTLLKRIIGENASKWKLTLPRIPYKEQRYFTPDEMLQIINASTGKWKVLFALLAETGLRCGEAFGLKPSDVNLKAQQLTVRRSIYKGRETSPKTHRGYRVVDINHELCQMLKEHLNGRTQGYIFTTRNNTPLGKDNSRHMLHRILERLNIPKGGLHSFRHGRVSILQAAGVPADLITQWMGHSSLKVTSTYTHFGGDFAQEMAAKNSLLNVNGPHEPCFDQKSESGQSLQAAGS